MHVSRSSEGDNKVIQHTFKLESTEDSIGGKGVVCDDDREFIDVTEVEPESVLPYDQKKVGTIMLECARHINLVKIPAENGDDLYERTLRDCGHQERALLQVLVEILQGDHLARLACANVANEPIKRRLNTDRTARQFRKVLADINWDSQLTRWAHETLLQVLNGDLLPIYLDILQVLKAKCPVLVEQMIHTSMNLVGGEQAFGLLLKRPWNPAAGLHSMDKQVKFDPAPIFVSLPYSTTGLGGRRWRMWHNQLGSIGRVYPIILPDSLTDMSKNTSLSDIAEQMLLCSLTRVHELRAQYPTRPIVLLGFSLAGRIAAKIAEVEYISCIVSLGLTSTGLDHQWERSTLKTNQIDRFPVIPNFKLLNSKVHLHMVDSDPFKDCKVPTLFAVGTEGRLSSADYVEELRKKMLCPTSLIVVGGGDDLLRLSVKDMYEENICQSIVDRSILDKIYEFMVHNLPCSYPEESYRHSRKKRASHTEDIGSTFLTPAVSQSPISLTSPSEDGSSDGKNFNFNNSTNPLWKTFLNFKHGGRTSPGSHSRSSSPIGMLERKMSHEGTAAAASKRPALATDSIPKVGRPRSKSMITKNKKKPSIRSRSVSSDQKHASNSIEPNNSSPIPFNMALNSNTNNNCSVESSPPGFLTIPQAHFTPLPITPPRNPYEDQTLSNQKLDPKTLKHLQRK